MKTLRLFKIYISIIMILFAINTYAQKQKSDLTLINQTLENYFQGYVERDLDKLNAAFDVENGTIKLPFEKDDKAGFKNGYFKEIIPKWASKDPMKLEDKNKSHIKVLNLDLISKDLASVKVEFKVAQTVYIDLLTLQNLKGKWKITNKSFIKL